LNDFEKAERRRIAQHRLRAQRLRAAALRSRVVAISLICFALLWGVVFVQMATGNDPVLGSAGGNDSRTASLPRSHGASHSLPLESARPEIASEPKPVEPEPEVEEVPIEEEPEAIEPEPEPVITGQS
jgi:hypothetical protein